MRLDFEWVRVEEYIPYTGARLDRLDELQALYDAGRIRGFEMHYDEVGMYGVFYTPGELDTRPRCEACGRRFDPRPITGLRYCSSNCERAATPYGALNCRCEL